MNQKVVAAIVTFNRAKMLEECVEAVLNQTVRPDKIIIINNASTDETSKIIESFERSYGGVIEGVHLLKNIGGAGGFAQAVLLVSMLDMGFVWLMDDDVEPRADCLENLLRTFKERNGAVDVVCPIIWGVNSSEYQMYHHKLIDSKLIERGLDVFNKESEVIINANAFVGPLFRMRAVREAGLPIAKYFIWSDDLEYTYRFGKRGRMLLNSSAVVDHKDKAGVAAPWKTYYGSRNYVDFMRANREENSKFALGLAIVTYRALKKSASIIIRGDSNGRRLCYYPLMGIWDGLTGNWVRQVER